MPTLILFDVSLSMGRIVTHSSGANPLTLKILGEAGVSTLLDYLITHARHEYIASMVFSALWEVKNQFGRDHAGIKSELIASETYDKSNIVNAIQGSLNLNLSEWSQLGPINLILVTDGQACPNSLLNNFIDRNQEDQKNTQKTDETQAQNRENAKELENDSDLVVLKGAFKFPCQLQIVCLADSYDYNLKYSIPFYKSLINIVDHDSQCRKNSKIWLPEKLDLPSVEILFKLIGQKLYEPFNLTLSCGHLGSRVTISPRFDSTILEKLISNDRLTINCESTNNELQFIIYGFLPIAEISSPASMSRHTIYPIYDPNFDENEKTKKILLAGTSLKNSSDKSVQNDRDSTTENNYTRLLPSRSNFNLQNQEKIEDEKNDEGNSPNFCQMLHSVLKSENLVALCKLKSSREQYAMIYVWNDNKKKSNLMLSIFSPGPNPIPWLLPLDMFGIPDAHNGIVAVDPDLLQQEQTKLSIQELKSYSSNCVLWLEVGSLQSDVQKVLRHARRLPDKNAHFFKELNRLRRAALSYGYYGFVKSLADIIEREQFTLSAQDTPNHEAISQLSHACACLRRSLDIPDSYEINIAPYTGK